MAVPTALHIGRPYMLCAPGRARGWGGGVAGLSPYRGLGRGGGGGGGGAGGGEGGGGRVTVASADGRPVPAHLGQGA